MKRLAQISLVEEVAANALPPSVLKHFDGWRLRYNFGVTRQAFAFETTLASRSFAPWIARQKVAGYRVHLFFLWLPSSEFAISRVRARVRLGGHSVSDDIVKRRYHAGLRNLFELYQPIADDWVFYDNTVSPKRIAAHFKGEAEHLYQPDLWQTIRERYRNV